MELIIIWRKGSDNNGEVSIQIKLHKEKHLRAKVDHKHCIIREKINQIIIKRVNNKLRMKLNKNSLLCYFLRDVQTSATFQNKKVGKKYLT